MTTWLDWHGNYDDPDSVQARRLVVVRRRVGEALDTLGESVPRVLSLCSGDGRDLIPELAERPKLSPDVVLVEWDPELAARASASAASAGVERVTVRTADAALRDSFADVLPADLLMLCGIFGNVSDDDIRRTIGAVPGMLSAGGVAIWTRGRCDGPDLRPAVRTWVAEAGLDEVAYDGEPELFGVGVARLSGARPAGVVVPERLFTFLR